MDESNKLLRFIYTLFLGALLAVFVGVGINAFYAAPQPPQYPAVIGPEKTAPDVSTQRQYEVQSKAYESASQAYNRNVSIIALAAAVGFVAASLVAEKRTKTIADGVMLGGLFTLLYSIGRSFASANNKYMFLVVTISLCLVLYLGYHRFSRVAQPAAKIKS